MTKEELGNLIGEFTWDFGQQFYIETEQGNFIWSDPDYSGDGSVIRAEKTFQDWIYPSFGRSKGRHLIKDYCKDFVFGDKQ